MHHTRSISARSVQQPVVLCAGILAVIVAAGAIIYWQGRVALVASVEQRVAAELAHKRLILENTLSDIVTDLESLAAQPVMVRILDNDEDHEIADLLDVVNRQFFRITQLTCVDTAGKSIASTDERYLVDGETFDAGWSRPELRYVMTAKADEDRVAVPIVHQFDEPEQIGMLVAVLDRHVLLRDLRAWWVGLASPSGDVLAQRGRHHFKRAPANATHFVFSGLGDVVIHRVPVRMPKGGVAPRWELVIATPLADLLYPVRILGVMIGVITVLSSALVVGLVLHFSQQQRHLLTALSDQCQRLETATRELTMQKKELVQSNDLLAQAEGEAVCANETKSEFLANMSHEIRTPMTAILGFAEILLDPELSHSERLNAIHIIRGNGQHLLQIINDILDMSKIEAGKLDVEQIRCSPVQVVTDVQSLMQARAADKGLSLTLEYIGAIPETIQSDPTRLKQILVNLTANAVKFTENGAVRLVTRFRPGDPMGRAGPDEPVLQFDVIDTGIGMTDEQVRKLFQAFAQADSSTTRKYGGTGLGLTVSKRLANLLGGDIVVTSEPGKGSTFSVTIATGPLDGVKMLDHPTQQAIVPDTEGAAGFSTRRAAPASSCDSSKLDCRILLAEDGPDNQRLIAHVLKKAGADVTLVENGRLAADAALAAWDAGNPFDVILMDMQMPVMDGYEATGLLRQKGYHGAIIALTAHAMRGDRDRCISAGCDEYATKPIDRRRLLEAIRRQLPSESASPRTPLAVGATE